MALGCCRFALRAAAAAAAAAAAVGTNASMFYQMKHRLLIYRLV